MLKGYLNTSLPERWDPTWSWRSIHTSADLETCGPVIQIGGGGKKKKWGHWEADGLTDGTTEMDKQQKTQYQ